MAKRDAKVGALIRTGGQVAAQLEAMLAARKLEEVRLFDLNYERTEAFAKNMQEELIVYGAKIIAVKSSDNADVIVTVTRSSLPVFDGSKVKAGATVSCVGAYQSHMQEMDPVILTRASKIHFDSKEAVLSEAGDILIPLADGIITEADFTGDLGDLLMGKIIVFETVGFGTQDLVTAKTIYDRAVENSIGLKWGETEAFRPVVMA